MSVSGIVFSGLSFFIDDTIVEGAVKPYMLYILKLVSLSHSVAIICLGTRQGSAYFVFPYWARICHVSRICKAVKGVISLVIVTCKSQPHLMGLVNVKQC